MEVLNGVVSKCIIGKSSSSSSVVASSKTQLSFTNKGHLDYYGEAAKGKKGWNGISTKKKIKLLKTLTKDLSTFSHLPFGFNFDHINQNDNNNNNNNSIIISQAAEVLLAQLKQLRTEEKVVKKKEKEEKKKKCKNSKCGSSSSESESSDSECDNKVVDIKRLRNASIVQPKETSDIPSLTTSSLPEPANEKISLNLDQECSNMILEATLNKDAPTPIDIVSSKTSNLKQSDMGKRIEVCMGGKCKKSGAPALLEELHKAIGEDGGVVIGCKCMGKCKTAPNVKVSTAQTLAAHDSLRYPTNTNPLYIGVGLEDVELIVATYFGEEVKGLGMSIASGASF